MRDVYTFSLRLCFCVRQSREEQSVLADRLQQGCIIHNVSQPVCTLPPGTLLFTVYFSGDIISSNSVSRESTCLIAAVSCWRSLTRPLPLQSVSAVKKLPPPPPLLLASLAHLSGWNFLPSFQFLLRRVSHTGTRQNGTSCLQQKRRPLVLGRS